jgi:acetyltransferase-like isoleucine patch superfamily enzyme
MFGKLLKLLYFDFGFKLRYLFWKCILMSSGGKIGSNVKIYESVRINCGHMGAISIGDDVRILRNVTISTSGMGKISIGNNVHIGEGTIIYSDMEITIGDNVVIGPQNVIVDFDHIYDNLDVPIIKQGHNAQRIIIEGDVWVSSHCSVIRGVIISKGSVIGAGSVVNKDIPAYSVACGVPVKVIKKRSASSPNEHNSQ